MPNKRVSGTRTSGAIGDGRSAKKRLVRKLWLIQKAVGIALVVFCIAFLVWFKNNPLPDDATAAVWLIGLLGLYLAITRKVIFYY